MALLDDQIAYWSLNEASGIRVDEHGDNDLSDNNTVASTGGKISDSALFVSANSEYLSIAEPAAGVAPDSTNAGAFSLAVWVYADLTDTGCIIQKRHINGATDANYRLTMGSSGTVSLFVAANGANHFKNIGGFPLQEWLFIVAVIDPVASVIRLSVNGAAFSDTAVATPNTSNGNTPLLVGAMSFGGSPSSYWDGMIDELRLWRRALTADDVAELWNNGDGYSGEQPSGPVAGQRIIVA